MRSRRLLGLWLGLLLLTLTTQAKIVKLVVTKTESYAGGRLFGKAGAYERVTGLAYGEVDPTLPANKIIQDLQLAPRNARGMVEYVSEFILLRPQAIQKANGMLFLSLPNRGNVFPADTHGSLSITHYSLLHACTIRICYDWPVSDSDYYQTTIGYYGFSTGTVGDGAAGWLWP